MAGSAAIQRPSPTMPLTKSPSPSQGEGWVGVLRSREAPLVIASAAQRGNPAPFSNNASHKISLPIAGGGLGWGCYGLAKPPSSLRAQRSAAIQRLYPIVPLTTKPLDRHGLRPRDDTAPVIARWRGKPSTRHCERSAAIQRPSQQCLSQNL